jgi:hypothetical protein
MVAFKYDTFAQPNNISIMGQKNKISRRKHSQI